MNVLLTLKFDEDSIHTHADQPAATESRHKHSLPVLDTCVPHPASASASASATAEAAAAAAAPAAAAGLQLVAILTCNLGFHWVPGSCLLSCFRCCWVCHLRSLPALLRPRQCSWQPATIPTNATETRGEAVEDCFKSNCLMLGTLTDPAIVM